MVREDDLKYSVEDWYRETKANYPEDLKELEDPEDETIEADWEDTTEVKFDESLLTERYSFPEVDDALHHFWNDLGKDPEVDDVIGFLEDEYPDWVPTDPDDYGRWYHDVAGEISARLSESKLTEAPMDVKDYAARLRARKAEKSQNPLEKINAQLDPGMEITDQLQVYFDELVPAQGKADTVAGELVRAMMRILYRDYNDGDLFYSGYGKETCGGSVVYLMDKLEDLERPFRNIVENQYEDQYYTSELEDAAYMLIEYLNNHPELFTQKNDVDSRNIDENRLDEYFDIPLYEFEPDTSYDESYYAVSDDAIDDFVRGVVESDLSSGQVNRWARDGWTIVDLDKEDYDTLQEMWDRWFRDFLVDYERQEEDEYENEEDFDESLKESSSYKSGDRYYGGLPSEPSFSEYGKAMKSRQERRKALIVFSVKVAEFDESTDYDKIFADSVKKIEFNHGFDEWWFERIDEDTWGKYENLRLDYTTTTDEIRKTIHGYIKNGFKTMRITALRATPV